MIIDDREQNLQIIGTVLSMTGYQIIASNGGSPSIRATGGTVDAEGRFIQMSAACQRIWGYLPEEMIGRQYFDFVHPEDHSKTRVIAAERHEGWLERSITADSISPAIFLMMNSRSWRADRESARPGR